MALTLQKSIENEYLDSLRKYPWLEGNINYMYLDSNGYVTVGRGHMILNAEAAKTLPFVDTSGKATEEKVIGKAYEWVKMQKANQLPKEYKNSVQNGITLSQDQIDTLARNDISEKIRILKVKFPKFNEYPTLVQMSLLDHWFNVKNASNFIKLIEAVRNENWSEAAFHSHLKTTPPPPSGVYARIMLKSARLCQAAKDAGQEKEGSFCSKFLEKINTQGFNSYEELIEALSKYQSTNTKAEDLDLIKKLKEIDKIFEKD